MHWEVLIIPLIALGVWILGTLFKGGEGDKLKKDVRRPSKVSVRASSRRPVTDLERFLEDARRRREKEERPIPPPAPPPAHTSIVRPPLRERPSRPRETPPRVAPPVIRREETPLAIPVAQPVAEPVIAEPIVVVPLAAPTTTRDTRLSPIAQQARSLLSKPQTAATAFVLREIFDRPLCKRRR